MLDALYHAIDPVAFSVGPFSVRWYGIAYLLGFMCAALIMYLVAKHWKLSLSPDDICTVMLCVIVGVLLGARLGYCIFYDPYVYLAHPFRVFAVQEGGMSFHGGLVGALVGGIVASKLLHIPFLTLADLGSIGAPCGLFFGRIANFINGELWGAETDLPWGVVFGGTAGTFPRHPSQLYEAFLEGIVLLAILLLLARKVPPKPRGTYLSVFLVFYGAFRIALEFVRQPDAQLGFLWGGWLTMGMVLSAPLVLSGVALFVYARIQNAPEQGKPLTINPASSESSESPADSKATKL